MAGPQAEQETPLAAAAAGRGAAAALVRVHGQGDAGDVEAGIVAPAGRLTKVGRPVTDLGNR